MATSNARAKVVVFETEGEWEWKLVVRGKQVGESSRSWPKQQHAKAAAEAITRNLTGARVVVE